MSIVQVSVYAYSLWMGLYMLQRGGHKLRYAALGTLSYAIGLAAVSLADANITWQPLVALAAGIFWTLALFQMRELAQDISRTHRIVILATVAAIFFLLTSTLLFIPQSVVSNTDLLLGLSVDIVILGYAVAWLHARDGGEALLPDAIRSLLLTLGGCVIFGGQVALILVVQDDDSTFARFILLQVIASVVVVVVFIRYLIQLVDRSIYTPTIQASRATLQEAADVLARTDPTLNLLELESREFDRLTRRALSNMNHPQRLVASPLMQLPLIDQHPAYKSTGTLERANILRTILSESIEKLKPTQDSGTGITEEWRHYNALYYPYVAGISTRIPLHKLDAQTRPIIEWLRLNVPERTLHNWQNAAAKLVAQDLREQLAVNGSSVSRDGSLS